MEGISSKEQIENDKWIIYIQDTESQLRDLLQNNEITWKDREKMLNPIYKGYNDFRSKNPLPNNVA